MKTRVSQGLGAGLSSLCEEINFLKVVASPTPSPTRSGDVG